MLRVTHDHISTSIHYKETDTHTYLHHQSSHPGHCKTGLFRSQLLRLLCYADSDFLEKGTEMVSFFEQRGYSPALLQNDLHNIRRIDRTDVLNNHRPFNRRSDRILLFLLTIKRILFRIFNILTGDLQPENSFQNHRWSPIAATATSVISSCVLRTATNSILTRVHLHAYTLTAALAITFPVIPTSFVIMNAFSCQMSGVVHCISCRRCPVIYIVETAGRILRQRFGEHLRSIEKNLPDFAKHLTWLVTQSTKL